MADGDVKTLDPTLLKNLLRYTRDLGWRDPVEAPRQQATATPARGNPDVAPATDLDDLARSLADCTRCRLSAKRHKVVFGEGDPQAALMFVGEGPGSEEDRSGRPFVGQAGQLLEKMIEAVGLRRQEIYIANVVKCRPPGNRDPEEAEMNACAEFLDRQIELIRPRVIVALGRVAARRLTGTGKPMGALRGRWSSYRGIPLASTYHPAYLLRNPREKRSTWSDLKAVVKKLEETR